MAADHEQLGLEWKPESVEIRVVNPRIDIEGWESEHTVVMVVTDDIPFLVDSVTMELSRLQIGIHLVVHPVLRDRRSEARHSPDSTTIPRKTAGAVSFIAIEVDRQAEPGQLEPDRVEHPAGARRRAPGGGRLVRDAGPG